MFVHRSHPKVDLVIEYPIASTDFHQHVAGHSGHLQQQKVFTSREKLIKTCQFASSAR